MFHELKEVKNERDSYNVKYFKEIKCSMSLQKAEAHLEPKWASVIELYGECI